MDILSLSSRLLLFSLLSRILGLCRDLAIAWIVGSGLAGDLLAQALRVPHIVRRLLAEGSLSMHLTAAFTGESQAEDIYTAVRAIVIRLFFCLTLLALIVSCFASDLLRPLLFLVAPYLFFAGLAALCMAYLHARGHFLLPALSPIVFNLCLLAFLGLAAFFPERALPLTALGFACAGVLQWALLAQALSRTLHTSSPSPEAWARARTLVCAQPLNLASASAYHLILFLVLIALSMQGEGQAAGLFYAERLLELPLGLIGVCFGMASLPQLSRSVQRGNRARFRRLLECSLHWTYLLLFPCVTGLFAVAEPLVTALFCHGNFDANGVHCTVSYLYALLPALPACAASRLFLGASFARGSIVYAAIASLLAFLAAATLLALGLAPVLCATVGFFVQALLLAAPLISLFRPSYRFFLYASFCALAAGFTAKVVFLFLPSVSVSVVSGVLAWLLALACLSPRDCARLKSRVLRGRA